MADTQWILQKIIAEDPSPMAVEWDTYNIGVVEDGVFRVIYSCFALPDAEFLIGALGWYTSFKEGNIVGLETGKAAPKKPAKKKTSMEE